MSGLLGVHRSASARRASLVRCTLLGAYSSLALACGASVPREGAPERGEPVHFSFSSLDGGSVDAPRVRGRVTVLLFATTFDLNSLAAIRLLETEVETTTPRINAVVVMLEPPRNVELVRTLAESEGARATFSMADAATLAGQGFFGRIHTVPTFVFLDRDGRLVDAFAGVPARTELRSVIARAR